MLGLFSPRIFLGAAQSRLMQGGLTIFTYHKLGRPPRKTRDPFLYVEPAQFEWQLAALREAGYSPFTLDELTSIAGPQPRKLIITFDDGFSSVLEHAIQPLRRHGFTAIQFLVAGFIGRHNQWDVAKGDVFQPLMDDVQVREWLAAGHQIGSHTMTHCNLRHVTREEAREEIISSKKALEDRFGVEVKHFCYPYGAYNSQSVDFARQAGYRTASTVRFGVNEPVTPPLELRRIMPLTSRQMVLKTRHRLARKVLHYLKKKTRKDSY